MSSIKKLLPFSGLCEVALEELSDTDKGPVNTGKCAFRWTHTPKASVPNHGSEISHRGVGAMHIENLCPPPSARTRWTETPETPETRVTA